MANLCTFVMQIKGQSKEGIDNFFKALIQDGPIWMGRGASASIEYITDTHALIDGEVKWSLVSSLIDNAKSMRHQRETGEGWWGGIEAAEEFLTLWEACERFKVNMEAYSTEEDTGFEEHFKYENGKLTANEKDTDYSHYKTWGRFRLKEVEVV